jgi:ubiquinone/menaquinone biosynthesis C-methylase UbiE
MPLYDFLAPVYDFAFHSTFLPFRTRAMQTLPAITGATVLDLACGSGQNFPLLADRIGREGKIIGVDISSGMLRRARLRGNSRGWSNVSLVQGDAAKANSSAFPPVDLVVCTYGFTSMRDWKSAFRASWALLKPGGGYLIHDIHAEKRTFHSRAVELATHSHFSEPVWKPLQTACRDFRMDYLDPSAHLFGGRLFVAYGTKPE